ncbi:EVE domain-containing protein [Hymenobacter sp. GOD-10R]|uniref:EVE domain-containing protein n=1 Tax=Hymenobacter sp. GOD-10R TaxID=3093922 RepID=UPI002D77E188|nr:EVE domain-containing protein [Hymenobacter sp. GOD-10R]WRQ30700.1 EVE domain-containing protein [Hymenobacter sp. GOD-10R]
MQQGIVQANHGKAAPLRRMQPGDGIVVYAPKLVYGEPTLCQRFVALGVVTDEPIYQATVGEDFHPFRRKARYEAVIETSIQPLLASLGFITNKAQWGYPFRFGCVEISQSNFDLIRRHMLTPAHDD